MTRLLVVEDEAHLADGLKFNLEAEGYSVDIAGDGESALERIASQMYDSVVLDVMLPGIDGFGVVAELRRHGNFVPVIILTARGRAEDVLKGFEAGADDYIAKPFDLSILLARLRGVLRRREWAGRGQQAAAASADSATAASERQPSADDVFRFDGKTIDFRALEVRAGPRTVHLTMMEAELLRHLIRNTGKVVSRKAILQDVWGLRQDTDTRAIDNFIVRLRRYIEDMPAKPRHLVTVRGVGYKFVPGS